MSNTDARTKVYSKIVKCAAKTCVNNSYEKPTLSFFPFPENTTYGLIWTTNAGRDDLAINDLYKNKKYVLCGEHFDNKYFVIERGSKPKFKENVKPIPTIFNNNSENNVCNLLDCKDYNIESRTKTKIKENIQSFSAVCNLDISNSSKTLTDINIENDSLTNIEFGQLKYADNIYEEFTANPGVLNMKTDVSDRLIRRDYCRLCAKQLPLANLLPIFNNNGNSSYGEMLEMCLPGKYKQEDIYPHDICSACVIKLEECCKTLKSFIEAENTIQKIFHTKETASRIYEILYKPKISEEFRDVLNSFNDKSLIVIDSTLCSKNLTPQKLNDHEIKIQCIICLKLFNSKKEISDHIKLNHGQGKINKSNYRFVKVKLKIKNENVILFKYQCLQCKQLYVNKKNIIQHARKNHSYFDDNKNFYKLVKVIKKVSNKATIRYECLLCNSQHRSKDTLYKHTRLHHKNVKDGKILCRVLKPKKYRNFNVTCLRCCESFESNVKYRIHMKKHASFKCEKCGLVFDKIVRLHRHVKIHNETNTYVCIGCDQQFSTRVELSNHEDIHKQPKEDVSCLKCKKQFTSAFSLRKHLQVHEPALCNVCGKLFPKRSYLERHFIIHSDKRPYKCNICSKSFKTGAVLCKHKQCHASDKKYICQFCGKQFKTSATLSQHVTIHSANKNHVCDICGSKFHRKGNLDKHRKTHNYIREDVFKCRVCEKELNNFTRYKFHIKQHKIGDKKPYSCKVCNKKFSTNAGKKVHFRLHSGERPFKCEYCEKTFRSKQILDQHRLIHLNVFPHECNFCDRKFRRLQSLIVHRKTHSGGRSFPCPICSTAFANRSDMIKHKEVHDEIVHNVDDTDNNILQNI